MFLDPKVLQKYFYDQVPPIWIDRAHQGLQHGIFRFVFCDWPKISYEPYFLEEWFLSTPHMFLDPTLLQKYFYNPVPPIWIDRARQGLQHGIFCFVFCDWPKISYEPYFLEEWFLSTPPMFLDPKVLQKYFYDQVPPIWIDRAHQGLQHGIFRFVFCDWPKISYEPYFLEEWFLSTPPMFSDYKVSQKYFYNPGLPIWMDVNVRHVCGGGGGAGRGSNLYP